MNSNLFKFFFVLVLSASFLNSWSQEFKPDPNGNGAPPSPKWDCINYSYEVELSFLQGRGFPSVELKKAALNRAIKDCSQGETKVCVEYFWKKFDQLDPKNTSHANWGKSSSTLCRASELRLY